MRRKKEQKLFCSVHAKSLYTTRIKLFINVYNAAHETLKLLGQGGYRSTSTTLYLLPEYHIFESFQGVDEEYWQEVM